MLALLVLAPGGDWFGHQPKPLAPWRPSLAVRFTGALTSFDRHVSDASDRAGYVTVSVSGVGGSDLPALSNDSAAAAGRVARSCRCRLRGYRVFARVPGRGVVVVASGGSG
jgi:hypothetical protein